VDGDYRDPATFDLLDRALGAAERPLHYLAIPPNLFSTVVEQLGRSGCARGGRVVAEKPIQNLAFSPLDLTVAAGATVTVMNMDTVQHSVTSETAKDSFQPGGVNGVSFDTQTFGTGTKTFTITASATSGTVVPYYCRVHTSSMTQGTITIQ